MSPFTLAMIRRPEIPEGRCVVHPLLAFLVGLWIGGFVGVFIMVLLRAASQAEDES